MTGEELAAIVARDSGLNLPHEFSNADMWEAFADRRALLVLLRETHGSFLNVEWNRELMCPWCDGHRPKHRRGCTQADLLDRLAALDADPVR
jgi:hypothetical protein